MAYKLGLQSSALKKLDITIGGNKINLSQIIQFKIEWDMNSLVVKGEIIIVDHTSFIEQNMVRGNEEVDCAMTDMDDEVCKEILHVTGVSHSRGDNGDPVVTLSLIDPLSIAAIQLYPEKSWESETMDNIIDDGDTLSPDLTVKEKDFGTPDSPHENFVIPMNQSFNVTIEWLKRNNNMMFFQNRDKYIMKPPADAYGGAELIPGVTFKYKTNNQAYTWNILEYRLNYAEMTEADLLQPQGKIGSFDINTKEVKWLEEDYAGALDKIAGPGSTPHDFGEAGKGGKRHSYKSEWHVQEQMDYQYQKSAMRDIRLEILVQGRFKLQIGKKVELDVVTVLDATTPEKNLNGEWIIVEMVDLIVPPDFVQRLTLMRAKFAE